MTALWEVLQVVEVDADRFRGVVPPTPLRQVYGGHLIGQAMTAALATAPDGRRPHSLQTYFLRPGRPEEGIDYHVTRTRDGSAFTTRTVEAWQGARLVAQVSVSFAAAQGGPAFAPGMPSAPDPTGLPTLPARVTDDPDAWPALYRYFEHFDVRYVVPPRDRLAGRDGRPTRGAQVWLKALAPQPYPAAWHATALAYVSDLSLLSVTLPVQSLRPGLPGLQMASLDHVVWFHRPCRVDEWLLYDQSVVATGSSLGLAQGHLFGSGGELVASVMQQGLVRARRTDARARDQDSGAGGQDARAGRPVRSATTA
jgi:acyl-CoA thioesterase II